MTNTSGYAYRCDRDDILVIGATDVQSLLEKKELQMLDMVASAYQCHARGQSSLPHSLFLKFPVNNANRIIALPAYLGGEVNSAGVKWIASFPANVERGLDRASAVLILNSTETGRPKAIMEGSLISANRTAASAALAARVLWRNGADSAGMIGCGLINLAVARFLAAAFPDLRGLHVYDSDERKACEYKKQCESRLPGIGVTVARGMDEVLSNSSLISFATTAAEPHVYDLTMCAPQTVLLHISLRDLSPDLILQSDNVVDDISHVCRAQTSVHLAEQKAGRQFIRCTLGDILNGKDAPWRDDRSLVVFSPFGLGILDIALGEYVFQQALANQKGTLVPSFFPDSWQRMA